MDEVLDKLVTELKKQLPKIESGAEKGLAQGLDRAREWAETHPSLGSDKLRKAMLDAIDRVDLAAPALSHLVGHNLVAVLDLVYTGNAEDHETRKEYFKTQLGFEERNKAAAANALARFEQTIATEEAWDEFLDMLEDIGQLALRALVPVLLAAI